MKKVMEVNAISHFWTVKAFVPDMIKKNHGSVVTVSSAAGITGVAGLTDYCASKFAAFGFNEALRLELSRVAKGVKTLCVCPYYINTGMFKGVKTRFPLILPILEQEYVTQRILDSIKRGDAFLILPNIVGSTFLARLLPTWFFDFIGNFLGVNQSMDSWIGREKRK